MDRKKFKNSAENTENNTFLFYYDRPITFGRTKSVRVASNIYKCTIYNPNLRVNGWVIKCAIK